MQQETKKCPTDRYYAANQAEMTTAIDKSVAFLGSDKDDKPGFSFPDNVLLPMILEWYKLSGKYPMHLAFYLAGKWSSEGNAQMIKDLIEARVSVLFFHPSIDEGSQTYKEYSAFKSVQQNYKCYYFRSGFEEIAIEQLEAIRKAPKKEGAMLPVLFLNPDDGRLSDYNEIAAHYIAVCQAHNPKIIFRR